MSFICGSFKCQKEDAFEVLWPSPLTPSRKTRKNRSCCRRNKEDKNPYSNRGLDKFEALLAEIEDKKRKIFTQKGSQYISFVRFMYSNSNDVKPIIVWLKDPRRHDHKDHHKQNNIKNTKGTPLPKLQVSKLDHHKTSKLPRDVNNVIKSNNIGPKEAHHEKTSINKVITTKKIMVDQWKVNFKRKLEEWWMPSYNLPLFVILVMLFLTFLGRSLAIICTSVAWYLVPKIDGTLANTTSSKKMIKSQHSRKPSENKMVSSPKPFFIGPLDFQQKDKMKTLMSF